MQKSNWKLTVSKLSSSVASILITLETSKTQTKKTRTNEYYIISTDRRAGGQFIGNCK